MADNVANEMIPVLPIEDLPYAMEVKPDSKFAMSQDGRTMKVLGEQIIQFAVDSVSAQTAAAQKSAEDAAESLSKMEETIGEAAEAAAREATEAAEAARDAAETASTAATEKAAEAAESAEKAEQYSGKPPVIQGGTWWTWDADAGEYADTGKRAVLNFDVVYPSYEAMEADKGNHPVMTTAIISSDVSDPHNAEIYIHDGMAWQFLADLSGFTGVGIESIEQTGGDHAPGTTDTYTVSTTDGKKYTITVYNGRDGEGAGDVQGVPFTVTLPAPGWADGKQTVNDSRFLASGRYSYIVGGASPKENRDEYNECSVQADGIPADGSMTFCCDSDPDSDLTVIIQRLENPAGGDTARIFNCGGGGGGGGGFPLDRLTILTPPRKTEYKSGELFDPDGMTAEVTYGNGLSVEVTSFTWSPLELTDAVENVTVTYSEGRKSVSALQPVTVIPVLSSIAVTKDPSKMEYVYLDTFQKDGMEVTAYYTDGSGHTVEGYTVQEPTFNRTGEFSIQISYEEGGVSKTATLTVDVGRAPIEKTPTQNGTAVHTGEEVSPDWNDYDPAQLEIGGETSAVEVGPHTAIFTPREYWQWADGGTEGREVQWEIVDAVIEVPVPYVSGSLTYTGGPQKPVLVGLDREHVDVSGDEEGTDAGDYEILCTLHKNCVWATGGNEPITLRWEIQKAIGILTVTPQTVTLSSDTTSAEVTVTTNSDGTITAAPQDPTIAKATVTGSTVKIESVDETTGETAVIISAGEGTNWTKPDDVSVSVNTSFLPAPGKNLDQYTPEEISQISKAGLAANYFAIGDETAEINMNGFVSDGLTLENLKIRAFIVGFDHNQDIESPGEHVTHFQLGKIGGVLVGIYDSGYGDKQTSGQWLNMYNTTSSAGGWVNSLMRKNIMGGDTTPANPRQNSLLATMPKDWRAVMRSVTKYTDNVGGGTDDAANVTATQEYFCLPAPFEYRGHNTATNTREEEMQQQYAYYTSANSRIHKKYDKNTSIITWCRSPRTNTTTGFHAVGTNGNAASQIPNTSNAVSPLFFI